MLVSIADALGIVLNVNTISLMKLRFVLTHTLRQTGIHSHITRYLCYIHPFCQNVVSLYFLKSITCLSVGVLRTGQVSSVSYKTVYRWGTKNCCFMSDVFVTYMNPYSSISIVTRLLSGQLRKLGSISGKDAKFSLSIASRPIQTPTNLRFSWVPVALLEISNI